MIKENKPTTSEATSKMAAGRRSSPTEIVFPTREFHLDDVSFQRGDRLTGERPGRLTKRHINDGYVLKAGQKAEQGWQNCKYRQDEDGGWSLAVFGRGDQRGGFLGTL